MGYELKMRRGRAGKEKEGGEGQVKFGRRTEGEMYRRDIERYIKVKRGRWWRWLRV